MGENNQMQNDIKTLLDFKNELEQLATQQNDKINSLNSVSVQVKF